MKTKLKNIILYVSGWGLILACIIIGVYALKYSIDITLAVKLFALKFLSLAVGYAMFASLLLLPLGIFRKTRGFGGTVLTIIGIITGFYVLIVSAIYLYAIWGKLGFTIGLFTGPFIVVVSVIATIFDAAWSKLWHIALFLAITAAQIGVGSWYTSKA